MDEPSLKKYRKLPLRPILQSDPARVTMSSKYAGWQCWLIQATSPTRHTVVADLNEIWEESGNTILTPQRNVLVMHVNKNNRIFCQWKTHKLHDKWGGAHWIAENIKDRTDFFENDLAEQKEFPGEIRMGYHEPYRLSRWTRVNDIQLEILADFVKGQHIVDLGGGNLTIAQYCLDLGAKAVTVVDHEFKPDQALTDPIGFPKRKGKIHRITHDLQTGIPEGLPKQRLLLASPPPDSPQFPKQPDWEKILPCFEEILYIGANLRGHICGNGPMWQHLIQRKIVAAKAVQRSAAIHYNSSPRTGIQILKEEAVGLMGLSLSKRSRDHKKSMCIPESSSEWILNVLNKPTKDSLEMALPVGSLHPKVS